MTVINTNIKSLYTQAALKLSERDGKVAMQQLATGKRINSARDDAAGLAISARMTQQIKGLNQASRNAGDAISFVQTVDGATSEITNMLQRMSELAVQAANATYSGEQRGFLDLEFQQLKQEIVRISDTHEWNGFKIMNGTAGTPIGPAPVTITSPTRALAAGEMSINTYSIPAPLTDGVSDETSVSSDSLQSAIAIAKAINSQQELTGVRAMPTGPVTSGTVTTVGSENGPQHLYLNGQPVPISMSPSDSPEERRANVIAAINNTFETHGVSASLSGSGGVSLTTKDGRNLSVWFNTTGTNLTAGSFGLGATASKSGTATVAAATNSTPSTAATNVQTQAINFTAKPALGETISITAGGISVDYVVSQSDMTSGGITDLAKLTTHLVSALNANSDFHGNVTASDTSSSGTSHLTLTGGAGVTLSSAIKFYPAAAAGVSSISNGSYQSHTASTLYGTVTLRSDSKPIIVNLTNPSGTTGSAVTVGTKDQSGNPVTQTAGRMSFQVGPAANQLITIDLQDFGKNGSITGMVTADVNSMEPSVNIKTVADANQVIDKIASAMDNVNAARSTMGAVMNRLEHVIDNLNTVSMNAEASRSQIEDADYAKASTELARTQIMQQAATAVLAQANTSQQTVLKLLQG